MTDETKGDFFFGLGEERFLFSNYLVDYDFNLKICTNLFLLKILVPYLSLPPPPPLLFMEPIRVHPYLSTDTQRKGVYTD